MTDKQSKMEIINPFKGIAGLEGKGIPGEQHAAFKKRTITTTQELSSGMQGLDILRQRQRVSLNRIINFQLDRKTDEAFDEATNLREMKLEYKKELERKAEKIGKYYKEQSPLMEVPTRQRTLEEMNVLGVLDELQGQPELKKELRDMEKESIKGSRLGKLATARLEEKLKNLEDELIQYSIGRWSDKARDVALRLKEGLEQKRQQDELSLNLKIDAKMFPTRKTPPSTSIPEFDTKQ